MLHTPSGRPAFNRASHNKYAVSEVNSLGLHTQVQPEAMHGAIFQLNRYNGRFHGTIKTATPAAYNLEEFLNLIRKVISL